MIDHCYCSCEIHTVLVVDQYTVCRCSLYSTQFIQYTDHSRTLEPRCTCTDLYRTHSRTPEKGRRGHGSRSDTRNSVGGRVDTRSHGTDVSSDFTLQTSEPPESPPPPPPSATLPNPAMYTSRCSWHPSWCCRRRCSSSSRRMRGLVSCQVRLGRVCLSVVIEALEPTVTLDLPRARAGLALSVQHNIIDEAGRTEADGN